MHLILQGIGLCKPNRLMAKVDLAFDHTVNKKDIKELSVVVYTDSFFYGLWDDNHTLVKVGYHPFDSLESVLSLWDYHYSFSQVNVLSAIKPYVHLPNEYVDEIYFEAYFKGLYNLDRIKTHIKKIDEFDQESISTLHFLDSKVATRFDDHVVDYQAAHISTAMANHSYETAANIICFVSNNRLHITLRNQNGHRFYNQFDCHYDHDYLYYMLLIMREFGLDPKVDKVKIGGDFNLASPLYPLIRRHITHIHLVEEGIKVSQDINAHESHYYDLYLCKTCV